MNDAKPARQDLEGAVTGLIVEHLGVSANKIRLNSSLFHDFGVDGADAIEFMEAFATRFHVDLSEFEPARHFGPEAGPNLIMLLIDLGRWLLTSKRPPELMPITVADLVRAAETGKWTESRSEDKENDVA